MGIKLYIKLPEKKDSTNIVIKKKRLKTKLFQNIFYTVEEYLQAEL